MPVTEVRHPLVQHKLSYLRDKGTPTVHFRKLVNEVTLLLTYEATKDLKTEGVEVETPLERAEFPRISGKKVAVCPILRAGVGMLDGVLSLISSARVLIQSDIEYLVQAGCFGSSLRDLMNSRTSSIEENTLSLLRELHG